MNPVRIALTVLAIATVAYAAYSPTGYATGTGTGTGTGDSKGADNEMRDQMGSIGSKLGALNPLNWLPKISEHVPSLESISFRNLASMPVQSAKALFDAIRQHSHLSPLKKGSHYVPNVEQVKLCLITENGNVSVPMKEASSLKNYPQLEADELTIFITGLPSNSENPDDAVSELVEAYRERYQIEENHMVSAHPWDQQASGNLIVIELGNELDSFKKWATLDIEATGSAIGNAIAEIENSVNKAKHLYIHLIGHGVSAHVAGVAAIKYSQQTGKQLPRVTGLDPSEIFTKIQNVQSGLNRGVADQVDVIHTTSFGAGSKSNGDADFFPEGPASSAPGSQNVFDASLKSVRYWAETVKPGGENNFMAVECSSWKDYEQKQCQGRRVQMGCQAPNNAKGNFILKVNPRAPYGRNARNTINKRNRSPSY